MNPSRLTDLLQSFQNKCILVVGDLMLDEFIWGKVSRISPEAPVPVVEVTRESYYAGGAANVARNLRPFCDQVHVMGVIGNDPHGSQLKKLLKEDAIVLDGLLEDPGRNTIVKTRIIARQQQVVRVDREQRQPLNAAQSDQLMTRFDHLLDEVDAVILEDYGKGFFIQPLIDRIAAMAQAKGKIVTADINPNNPLNWTGLNTVKPNRSEAFAAVGRTDRGAITPVLTDHDLLEVGQQLRSSLHCKNILITLGEHGMLLLSGDLPPYHTPTRAREVFDVSGAGDTAIALFTLALASGATAQEAAEISNHGSGVVVGKLGTATITPTELKDSFKKHD